MAREEKSGAFDEPGWLAALEVGGAGLVGEAAALQYVGELNAAARLRPCAALRRLVLARLEAPSLSHAFEQSAEVQRSVVALLARVYRGKLRVRDLLTLFELGPAGEDDDVLDAWAETKAAMQRILEVLYWRGVTDRELEADLVADYCRLLRELTAADAYFASARDEASIGEEAAANGGALKTQEHFLSQYCLRIQALAESLLEFGSVGKRLWPFLAEPGAVPGGEDRVVTVIEVFCRVCDLMPGDGFDMRGTLCFGDFCRALALPFAHVLWLRMLAATTGAGCAGTGTGAWHECVDYTTGRFFWHCAATSQSQWALPRGAREDAELAQRLASARAFASTLRLLLSLSYENGCRGELARTDITAELLQQQQAGYSFEAELHRAAAWLLLFNVACCYASESKELLNHALLDKWLGTLPVHERTRIWTAFREAAGALPSHGAADSLVFARMEGLLLKARCEREDASLWLCSTDPASGLHFFRRLAAAGGGPQQHAVEWERPCVGPARWTEREDRDGRLVYHDQCNGRLHAQLPAPGEPPAQNDDAGAGPELVPAPAASRRGCASKLESKVQESPPRHRRDAPAGRPPPSLPRAPHLQQLRESASEAKEEKLAEPAEPASEAPPPLASALAPPPRAFLCALSGRLMKHPVQAGALVFDRQCLHEWLAAPDPGAVAAPVALALSHAAAGRITDHKQLRRDILLWHIRALRSEREELYHF
jgi:hypothetical protein